MFALSMRGSKEDCDLFPLETQLQAFPDSMPDSRAGAQAFKDLLDITEISHFSLEAYLRQQQKYYRKSTCPDFRNILRTKNIFSSSIFQIHL